MKFLTGSYCGDADDAALVLVRGRRIRDDLPIVLMGIWEPLTEAAGELPKERTKSFGDMLLEWFDVQGLPVCTKGAPAKCIKAIGRNYVKWYEIHGRNELDRLSACRKASWSVFVSVGEECFYAWKGDAEIHLLNLCFNRLNRRKLSWYTNEMQIEFAGLEPGVGILLGTKSFCEYLPEKRLMDCLAVTSMENSNQIEKHLKEASLEAESRGAEQLTAVLTVTGRDGYGERTD